MTGKFIASLLIAVSTAWAQPFSVGVKGGFPLTDGLSNFHQLEVDVTTHDYSNSKLYIVGPMVEVHLPLSLAIEFDALYRPVNLTTDTQVTPLGPIIHTSKDITTWEFPILGKYRLPLPVVKPYVEAGPSFRKTYSGLSWLSDKGATIGAGVEVKIRRLRFGPEVRYSRWGSDGQPPPGVAFFPPSKRDQAEFLVGISF
ncbi:MAG TPA: hypothetical protein VGR73_11325 [Bryobacteraceae bacterium]|nr:hypothetical protein [Bryobacteraceae bacterium]